MTNNSFTMTAHQYVKFTSSPFVMQMYVDKMFIESAQTQPNGEVKVTPGEGIDLEFYSDIYIPFITWYNTEQSKLTS